MTKCCTAGDTWVVELQFGRTSVNKSYRSEKCLKKLKPLISKGFSWWAHLDLNQGPPDYEKDSSKNSLYVSHGGSSLYVSYGGTLTSGQMETIKKIKSQNNLSSSYLYVIAVDNDKDGKHYTQKILAALE